MAADQRAPTTAYFLRWALTQYKSTLISHTGYLYQIVLIKGLAWIPSSAVTSGRFS